MRAIAIEIDIEFARSPPEMTAQTAQAAPLSAPVALPSFDPSAAVAAALAVGTLLGIVVAPAMTFFAALAVVGLVVLDRAARAADEEFATLVPR